MENFRNTARLTPSQHTAVTARGNVLVMAGAGTGKTHTLIQRCLACLREEGAALDELLIVTFTEAAAAEMRRRLRQALEEIDPADPAYTHGREQLALFATAHIGTLHSFCLKLVREHFYELGLDPDLTVLETAEAHLCAQETLAQAMDGHYAGETGMDLAVQNLIQIHGAGRDEAIRALILRLHHYAQTRPDAAGWLAAEAGRFATAAPDLWEGWLREAIRDWRAEWLPQLELLRGENPKAAEFLDILRRLPVPFTRAQSADVLAHICAAGEVWPPKKKTALAKPLKPLLADAAFLASLARLNAGADPLAEDWEWTRVHMRTLLHLAENFERDFSAAKLRDGTADFHDLEQFALKLLWNFPADQPTPVAQRWRAKLRFVFVDEYQDINAAQDKIIQALSRPAGAANRFLVGDVKQSIYRFRLADPKIFRGYAEQWGAGAGTTLALTENFRSREGLLNWVNALFAPLMRAEFGGVKYDASARLQFGSPETRLPLAFVSASPPRAEVLLLLKSGQDDPLPASEAGAEGGEGGYADLDNAEKEARLLAGRLKRLRSECHEIWDDQAKIMRPVEWRDMAVLLRAPGSKAEIYAREFDRAGIPLVVERGGFYQSAEIADLLAVLQLLDNPLQDAPAIAVLRSPMVGLSLDELAQIRLNVPREHYWTALSRSCDEGTGIAAETRRKITVFLERFSRWRKLVRQAPLVPCLETLLAETNYQEWLQSRPRCAQRQASVRRFLALAEQFDQFQQQGLQRFLKFIEIQQEADAEPEVLPVLAENAVRLMSIHQSKGLEFPVVALADIAKGFNTQDQRAEIIFDETFGLCPRVKPPASGRRYPSLPNWLAQRTQSREQAGEELRLLYVALTRARDSLLLTGSVTEKKWEDHWHGTTPITAQSILAGRSYADWIGLWFAQNQEEAASLVHCQLIRDFQPSEVPALPAAETSQPRDISAETPSVLDHETRIRLHTALNWHYACAAATEFKAKTSVTALRRLAGEALGDEEAQPLFSNSSGEHFALSGGGANLSAEEVGTANHAFLQHVRLNSTESVPSLTLEAARMVAAGWLSSDESRALDLPAIAAFWNSPVGQGILRHAAFVARELAFTAQFRPEELADLSGLPPGTVAGKDLENEFVVVQGVADLVVRLPGEIWLVDFKTDRLMAAELASKIVQYRPQLAIYAAALTKIYRLPVTRRWLHFLSVKETVTV